MREIGGNGGHFNVCPPRTGGLVTPLGVGFVVVQVLDYDVNVNVEIKFDRNLNFPAVTVCNTNPVLKSKLLETSATFRRHFDGKF